MPHFSPSIMQQPKKYPKSLPVAYPCSRLAILLIMPDMKKSLMLIFLQTCLMSL